MKKFDIKENTFYIDGKEEPLLCGEIHYFRMPKEYWGQALDRLVKSGCNAVAYYVPWFVHEYQEGKFDFLGEINPDNDLHSWIKLTMEKGLIGFIRPGPYIYAETADLGIPKWFTAKYPNAHVKGYKDGEYVNTGFERDASHNHPDFVKSVAKWYERLCAEVRQYLAPSGNIAMFQLCNEIPGDDIDDRNKENLGIGDINGIFPRFLLGKYTSLEELNQAYCSGFESVECIEPHMLEEKDSVRWFNDHLEFYYTNYFPEYFQTLRQVAIENGIDVQLVHNAYNPRAISLHYQNKKKNPWLNVGVDCYYSLTGRIGLKDATYYCEYGAEYLKNFLNNVPWVVEQECGYWNDYPTVYGVELYIWNIWTIAGGYKGFNMYLFAAGLNKPGMGFFGTDHNWQAPVSYKGEKNHSFEDIKRSITDIKANSETFMSDNKADIGFGVKNANGLIWRNVAKASNEAFFALKTAGFTPKLVDFEGVSIEELKKHKSLWIVTDEYMDKEVQEKLCEYMKDGNTLIVNGTVPYKDYRENECRIIADQLNLRVSLHKDATQDQQKLILDNKEYFIGRTIQTVEVDSQYIVATDMDGERPAAIITDYGSGKAVVLPFSIEVSFNSISECLTEILEKVSVQPQIKGARMLRAIPKQNGNTVLLNLHPIDVEEEICVYGKKQLVKLKPHSFKII